MQLGLEWWQRADLNIGFPKRDVRFSHTGAGEFCFDSLLTLINITGLDAESIRLLMKISNTLNTLEHDRHDLASSYPIHY